MLAYGMMITLVVLRTLRAHVRTMYLLLIDVALEMVASLQQSLRAQWNEVLETTCLNKHPLENTGNRCLLQGGKHPA